MQAPKKVDLAKKKNDLKFALLDFPNLTREHCTESRLIPGLCLLVP